MTIPDQPARLNPPHHEALMTTQWITDRLPTQKDTFTREGDPTQGVVLTLQPSGIVSLTSWQSVQHPWMRRYFDD